MKRCKHCLEPARYNSASFWTHNNTTFQFKDFEREHAPSKYIDESHYNCRGDLKPEWIFEDIDEYSNPIEDQRH